MSLLDCILNLFSCKSNQNSYNYSNNSNYVNNPIAGKTFKKYVILKEEVANDIDNLSLTNIYKQEDDSDFNYRQI